jgi:hypothetical protein
LVGNLASGVDFEPKNPGFNPETAQKSEYKFHCPTRQSETTFYEIENKTSNFGRIIWNEIGAAHFNRSLLPKFR